MLLWTFVACNAIDWPNGPPGWEDVGHAPDPDRPDPEAIPDPDGDAAAPLFAEGAITDLALHVEQSAIATLEADDDAEVHAVLTHGGRSWEVGLRRKGNVTRRGFDGKPSLKIDLGAWVPNQRFYGLRRLTLNNMVQDKSMLKEHVAYRLYRDLGVPAPRHGYVRLAVNDQAYGLYGLIESMDEQFVDVWWPDDDGGNLYEGGYGGDVATGRTHDFTVQEAGEPLPPTDLAALVEALGDATPETMHATLERYFSLDATLDALAVDLLAGNWDGYARAANNFLLYHAPEADRWWLVPWGQDQAFTDRWVPVHAGWEGRILVLCGRSQTCTDHLYERVDGALLAWDGLPEYAQAVADAIAADCEADPRAEIPCSPGDVLAFLAERPGIVAPELASRP